eukprot:166861-Rhodomonas_salina.1
MSASCRAPTLVVSRSRDPNIGSAFEGLVRRERKTGAIGEGASWVQHLDRRGMSDSRPRLTKAGLDVKRKPAVRHRGKRVNCRFWAKS